MIDEKLGLITADYEHKHENLNGGEEKTWT
jgi:hypothetical protein